jgi:hypothetical protein
VQKGDCMHGALVGAFTGKGHDERVMVVRKTFTDSPLGLVKMNSWLRKLYYFCIRRNI